jgi:hypothetical protein
MALITFENQIHAIVATLALHVAQDQLAIWQRHVRAAIQHLADIERQPNVPAHIRENVIELKSDFLHETERYLNHHQECSKDFRHALELLTNG